MENTLNIEIMDEDGITREWAEVITDNPTLRGKRIIINRSDLK